MSVTDPLSHTTTYGYDAASQFTTITKGTQTVTLAYDDAGRRTSLTYPNGVVTSYGYDNANRVLSITHVKAPTTIESLTYTYDPTGNRLSQTRANAAASNLPTAVAAAQITYDAANELLRWNNATNNLTYDNNGNLATETVGGVTTTYTWDSRNRLTGISKTGLTASFVYDGLGRRKSKTVNGSTTGFWYDGNDMYAELSGTTPSFTYIRGLNIDEPYVRKGASDEFYETDALGSSVALTNSAGASQTTYTYEPFGTTTQAGTASTNPFQFTGRENDGTGLTYYRARYYSPRMGRFISEDPIGIVGGFNFYSYVRNKPINNWDPLGLCVIGFTRLSGEDGIIIAATNDGNLSVGPFPASNNTITNNARSIPSGYYPINQPTRFGSEGVATSLGLDPSIPDPNRTNQQVFGDAFIGIPNGAIPGRTGIGIHATDPLSGGPLRRTEGCVRVHNTDLNNLATFMEQNCKNEPNTFIKQ